MYNALIIFGIALAYAVLKIYFEKRLAPLDAAGDERQLAEVAFASGCSVYELFNTAGSIWNFSAEKIEGDFKQYLLQGDMPPYLKEYVRRHLDTSDRTYQTLLYPGGRPPYL